MDQIEARRYIRSLTMDGKGFESSQDGVQWQDQTRVATDSFRFQAIQKLSRETIYDPAETVMQGVHPGIAVVEIYLTEPLPGIERFYGIFAVDDYGIWYSDSDQNIQGPVWQQRVIPWRYVKTLVLHQRS